MSTIFPTDVRERFFTAVAYSRPLAEVVGGILRAVKRADLQGLNDGKEKGGLGGNAGEGVLLESVRRKLMKDSGEKGRGEGVVV
jgi:hypothetical protein